MSEQESGEVPQWYEYRWIVYLAVVALGIYAYAIGALSMIGVLLG